MTALPRPLAAISAITLIVVSIGCDRAAKPVVSVAQEEKMPDVTLAFEISSDTTIQCGTFKLKGKRARIDGEEGLISTIHDPDVGTTLLDHAKKTYKTIQFDLPDNSRMNPDVAALIASAFQMKFTGKTKKIGEWECAEFILLDSIGTAYPKELQSRCVGWIAKELKGGAAIQARKDKVAPSQLLKWMTATTSKDISFRGFAVRTETRMRGQYPVVSTCYKISYDTIDPKELEIPSGYTDISPKKTPSSSAAPNGVKPPTDGPHNR